jgi:hypothetical protein
LNQPSQAQATPYFFNTIAPFETLRVGRRLAGSPVSSMLSNVAGLRFSAVLGETEEHVDQLLGSQKFGALLRNSNKAKIVFRES